MGRVGGRKSHCRPTDSGSLPILANSQQMCEVLPRLFGEIYAGQLSPRTATALLGVLNLQFRAIELADVQRRLDAIERVVGAALDPNEPDQLGNDESLSAPSTDANTPSRAN